MAVVRGPAAGIHCIRAGRARLGSQAAAAPALGQWLGDQAGDQGRRGAGRARRRRRQGRSGDRLAPRTRSATGRRLAELRRLGEENASWHGSLNGRSRGRLRSRGRGRPGRPLEGEAASAASDVELLSVRVSPAHQRQHQRGEEHGLAEHQQHRLEADGRPGPAAASSCRCRRSPPPGTSAKRRCRAPPRRRQPAGAVDRHQHREGDREPGQQRRALVAGRPRPWLRARVIITANTITGSSIATRISLTSVATSPVSCDML